MARNKKYTLKIITDSDKLSIRTDESNVFENGKRIISIINDLKDTLLANKYLVALSAPQLGYNERIFCINFNGDIRSFINPLITKSEGRHYVIEHPLSNADECYLVPRNNRIMATYQTPTCLLGNFYDKSSPLYIPGKPEESEFRDLAAVIFQQMVDILEGNLVDRKLLGSDYYIKVDKDFLDKWEKSSEEEKEQFKEEYDNRLIELNKLAEEIVEKDEISKQIVDASRFMTKLASGEITLDKKESGN